MAKAKKRRCSELTKAGKACKGTPIAETDFTTCRAHAPKEVREKSGFGGAQRGAGRPAKPKAIEILRERVEDRVDEVLAPLFDGLTATRGIALNVQGGGMVIETIPDIPTRITAARELLDRAYGRPKQLTELTGAEGGPLTHEFPETELAEWNRRVAGVIVEAEAATAGAANGNGHRNGSG
jgi:hypothetical protein